MMKHVLFLFFINSFPSLTESVEFDLSHMFKFGALAQALKYGDQCSFEAEKLRQEYFKEIMDGNTQLLIPMTSVFNSRNYKMCSATELFVCDEESEKCVCGDAAYEAYKGKNRSLYSSVGNKKCRWNLNSYCIPEDAFSIFKLVKVKINAKCRRGTSCRTSDGELCSLNAITNYSKNKHPGISNKMDEKLLQTLQDTYSDKICTCVSDPVVEVADEEPTSKDNAYQFKAMLSSTFISTLMLHIIY